MRKQITWNRFQAFKWWLCGNLQQWFINCAAVILDVLVFIDFCARTRRVTTVSTIKTQANELERVFFPLILDMAEKIHPADISKEVFFSLLKLKKLSLPSCRRFWVCLKMGMKLSSGGIEEIYFSFQHFMSDKSSRIWSWRSFL